jgi:membrane peptidoglycan carboxypeptidase
MCDQVLAVLVTSSLAWLITHVLFYAAGGRFGGIEVDTAYASKVDACEWGKPLGAKREARKAEERASCVGLDEILGWQSPQVAERRLDKSRSVLGGLAASVFGGLLVASMCMPLVGATDQSLEAANNYWNNMPSTLPDVAVPSRSVILAADGTRIAQFYSENRVPVTYDLIPQVMRDAIVSIEDSRFYEHNGVDFKGTGRALAHNLLSDSTQGGSTLTQQYVKNVLASAADDDKTRAEVTSRTSYLRKLREAKLAIELERRETKEEILTGYLNIAYFGDGAYGIGTAAGHYFSKHVKDLTLDEAALLAGLVQSPYRLDPTENPTEALNRRAVVLMRMRQLGYITPEQEVAAKNTPLRLKLREASNGCTTSQYPFYCQWVKQQLENDPAFGKTEKQRQQRLFRGGMVIKTALDPRRQKIAQEAVDKGLGRDNRVTAAAVVVEPGTGHVVAMATNRDFGTPKKGHFDKTEIVLPTVHGMQPGSTFKVFTLAAALERGFDPNTVLYAPPVYKPSNLNSPKGGFSNAGAAEAGQFNARTAFARSSNTWFVKLEEQVGVLNVASMAERLGVTSLPRSGPGAITKRDASLTLGAYEVSPVDMAGAYATFAAHGVHCTPLPIVSIAGPGKKPVAVPSNDCHQAIPASVADTVADIAQGVVNGPDPYRTGVGLGIGRPVAGKTGTTQGHAAVWFSGFTPQYATSVWVGDPRGGFQHPLVGFYANGHYVASAYGASVAGPMWRDIMKGVHAGLPVKRFSKPSATVTLGTVTPDVRGLTLDQAYRALTEAGFKVEVDADEGPRDVLLSPNRVYGTNPAGGTFLGLRSVVTITMTDGSSRNVRLPD